MRKMSGLQRFVTDLRAAQQRGLRLTGDDILSALESEMTNFARIGEDKPFYWEGAAARAEDNCRKRYQSMGGKDDYGTDPRVDWRRPGEQTRDKIRAEALRPATLRPRG